MNTIMFITNCRIRLFEFHVSTIDVCLIKPRKLVYDARLFVDIWTRYSRNRVCRHLYRIYLHPSVFKLTNCFVYMPYRVLNT